ncbi:MAG: S8 family peptidase, partial [Gemmatimonadales bacterium]
SGGSGGGHPVTGAVIGGAAGGAAGALIGGFLDRRPAPSFVPGRVLALIALAPADSMLATAWDLIQGRGLLVVEVHPLASSADGLVVFEIRDGGAVADEVAALRRDPRVRLAQPDFIHVTLVVQTDAAARLSYGPRLIRADRLRGTANGSGITVAVIDTGLDSAHIEFKGTGIEALDVSSAGFTPDVHGTLVAGIIAADPHNGFGIGGVAPGARLLAIKACVPDAPAQALARCRSSALARGVDAAVLKQARVLNLSVGGPRDDLLARLVRSAVAQGRVVVAAAGNDGPRGRPRYPAALEEVVAVTAVDAAERLYPEATRGRHVDLAAPGVEIFSTSPGNSFAVASGTSLAAAHVTAAVTVLLAEAPGTGLLRLRAVLDETAKDLGPSGPDRDFGGGLVDVCRALERLSGAARACD